MSVLFCMQTDTDCKSYGHGLFDKMSSVITAVLKPSGTYIYI